MNGAALTVAPSRYAIHAQRFTCVTQRRHHGAVIKWQAISFPAQSNWAPHHSKPAAASPDGNRVHFEPIDCLIGFGQRWRSDAQAALLSLGLKPPDVEASRP
jgi:hypothetical protein